MALRFNSHVPIPPAAFPATAAASPASHEEVGFPHNSTARLPGPGGTAASASALLAPREPVQVCCRSFPAGELTSHLLIWVWIKAPRALVSQGDGELGCLSR